MIAWGFGEAGFQTIARGKAGFNHSNRPRTSENGENAVRLDMVTIQALLGKALRIRHCEKTVAGKLKVWKRDDQIVGESYLDCCS